MNNLPTDKIDNKTTISKEEALSLILNNIEGYFILIDRDLKVIGTNTYTKGEVYEYFGLQFKLGMNILDLAPPSRHPFLKDLYADVFKGEDKQSVVELMLKGEKKYFEIKYKPARNDSGEIVAALVTTKNVTKRKRAEETLKEIEERWQFSLEGSNQGAWDWNLETNEVIYSPSYKKMYGFDEDELMDNFKEWSERIHPDDKKNMEESINRHLKGNNPYLESTYRIKDKEGNYKWILAKGMLISRDAKGKPLRMIGTHTDITDKKTAEENYKLLFYNNPLPMWTYNINSLRFTDVNEAAIRHYGYTREEFLSMKISQIRPPEEVVQLLKAIEERKSTITSGGVWLHLKKNGEVIYVEISTYKFDDQKDPRVLVLANDITEKIKAEEELIANELERQKAINQATIDTQEQERSEIGKELHDNVNQVLTTTKLYLDLALSNNELKDELIKKSSKNIISVINEIRQLSRSLMDPSIGDLGLIDSIKDLIENINLTRKLQVILYCEEMLDCILDKNQKLTIFRIIQEALNNAIRHAKASAVTIHFQLNDEELKITIQDDGIGFNKDSVKKGAGLKNIQNRIYLINGSYVIHSSPGNGCKIVINFPIK